MNACPCSWFSAILQRGKTYDFLFGSLDKKDLLKGIYSKREQTFSCSTCPPFRREVEMKMASHCPRKCISITLKVVKPSYMSCAMTLKTQIPKSKKDTRGLIDDNFQTIFVNFLQNIGYEASVEPSH